MWFRVHHSSTYRYERPVGLGPHRLRLTPRAAPGVTLLRHCLRVEPEPAARWDGLDPDGNLVTGLRFDTPTDLLAIESSFELHTDATSAATVTPAATAGPLAFRDPYGPGLQRRLAPWLARGEPAIAVAELADALGRDAGEGLAFLHDLTRHLHRNLEPEIRLAGAARPPEQTLRLGRGACRDLTLLFLALSQRHGWAGRFVSGYQARGHPGARRRHMHAWPEVYVPGLGWQGFDPTHGLPVGEAHVALAAAADPADAAPIEGSFIGAAPSRLDTSLRIETR